MKTITYTLELLTPCFCAGADQAKAEIRAPSIRGQLRWWFRVLGGFKSLAHLPLKQQESYLFGSAAGDEVNASPLVVRVTQPTIKSVEKSGSSPEANIREPTGYLLFPLRNKTRGAIEPGRFELRLTWRGDSSLWRDIQSLVTVFINLGALGFRSRRGYGAFAPTPPLDLKNPLAVFNATESAIAVGGLPACANPQLALVTLVGWLKGWRSHGRSGFDVIDGRAKDPANMPGFRYALADHDAGYGSNRTGPTYRPALGLPIIQKCGRDTNSWELTAKRGEARFASPVLLRPHRTADGKILPLIIFVNARAWPEGQPVYLNNQKRLVSTDLYQAMQNDPKLKPFTL